MRTVLLFTFLIVHYSSSAQLIIKPTDQADIQDVDVLNHEASNQLFENPGKSIINSKIAFESSKELNYNKGKIKALQNLGVLYFENKLYEKAENVYLDLLSVFEESSNKKAYSESLIRLAQIANHKQDVEKAENYYNESVGILKSLDDSLGIANVYFKLGVLKYNTTDYSKAIRYFKNSLLLYEDLGQKSLAALSHHYIGKTYFKQGAPDLGIEELFNGLYIYQEVEARNGEALICNEMGKIYLQTGKYHKAIEFAGYAYEISSSIGLLNVKNSSTKMLSEAYAKVQDFKTAYRYQEEQKIISDSISKSETLNKASLAVNQNEILNALELIKSDQRSRVKISELEDQYNRAVITAIIAGISLVVLIIGFAVFMTLKLRKCKLTNYEKNSKIHQLSLELEKVNATKNKFFSIISHDIKNPFNALLGFSNLLATDYDEFNDIEKKKFIKQIYESTESITKLLNNLLEWAKSQSGIIEPKKEELDLSKVVRSVIPVIKTHAGSKYIQIKNNIDENSPAYADSNMLSTIVRNLLTNAVKFTPDKGEVQINSQYNGKYVELSIEDNGIGIPKKHVDSLFNLNKKNSINGTRGEIGSGMGLLLCKEFVEKNGGKIWAESEEGSGSKFKFTVPIKDEQ